MLESVTEKMDQSEGVQDEYKERDTAFDRHGEKENIEARYEAADQTHHKLEKKHGEDNRCGNKDREIHEEIELL